MSHVYAQRSSAVRAAKKAARPDQEWTIVATVDGFIFQLMNIDEAQPKAEEVLATLPQFNHNTSEGRQEATRVLAEVPGFGALVSKVAPTVDTNGKYGHTNNVPCIAKPYQLAKAIVADMPNASRKEIIAAGIAAGIKYNTIDGAYFELRVRKS